MTYGPGRAGDTILGRTRDDWGEFILLNLRVKEEEVGRAVYDLLCEIRGCRKSDATTAERYCTDAAAIAKQLNNEYRVEVGTLGIEAGLIEALVDLYRGVTRMEAEESDAIEYFRECVRKLGPRYARERAIALLGQGLLETWEGDARSSLNTFQRAKAYARLISEVQDRVRLEQETERLIDASLRRLKKPVSGAGPASAAGPPPPAGTPGTPPAGTPGTPPAGTPGTSPASAPGAPPASTPGTSPAGAPGTPPTDTPGTAPAGTPGTEPADVPNSAPPAGAPDMVPQTGASDPPPPTNAPDTALQADATDTQQPADPPGVVESVDASGIDHPTGTFRTTPPADAPDAKLPPGAVGTAPPADVSDGVQAAGDPGSSQPPSTLGERQLSLPMDVSSLSASISTAPPVFVPPVSSAVSFFSEDLKRPRARPARLASDICFVPVFDGIAAGPPLGVDGSDNPAGYVQTADVTIDGEPYAVQSLLDSPEVKLDWREYDYFATLVHGDSMIERGICDGDYVLLRKPRAGSVVPKTGDIVAAVIEGEDLRATLKRFQKEQDRCVLIPENSDLSSYYFGSKEAQPEYRGIAVAVLKRIT